MNRNLFSLAAAAALVLAQAAGAGDFNHKMAATIPFAFQTPNGAIEAGSYEVLHGNGALVGLRDRSSGRMVLTNAHRSVEFRYVNPMIAFVCSEGESCWIKEIRSGNERYTYQPPRQVRVTENRKLYTVTVPLNSGRSTD